MHHGGKLRIDPGSEIFDAWELLGVKLEQELSHGRRPRPWQAAGQGFV
jgi:hypothetical protein